MMASSLIWRRKEVHPARRSGPQMAKHLRVAELISIGLFFFTVCLGGTCVCCQFVCFHGPSEFRGFCLLWGEFALDAIEGEEEPRYAEEERENGY